MVPNFVLGEILAYNFIKLNSSESHTYFFKEQVFSATPQAKLSHAPTFAVFKFSCDHKVALI